MRRILKYVLFTIVGFLLLANLLPRETVDWTVTFDESVIGEDVDAYLAQSEAKIAGITPGAEKHIDWNGAVGAQTDLAVVYIHGFSATWKEIHPVTENVAASLGANIFYTRLAGHGRSSQAMAEATAGAWYNDLLEALAIGRRIGKRTLLITTSTGGTIGVFTTQDYALAKHVAGIVFVSPNFGLASRPANFLLNLPFVRYWAPIVAGKDRAFEPSNAEHDKWWTNAYPTVAVMPMMNLIRHAIALDYDSVITPALFIYSNEDQVVHAPTTKRIADAWRADSQVWNVAPQDGIEPLNHVLAGDVLSPANTAPTVAKIVDWAKGL